MVSEQQTKRALWQRLGCIVVLIALLPVLSFGDKAYYCRICGRWRYTRSVMPLQMVGWYASVDLSDTVSETELSRLLASLAPGRQCKHDWVLLEASTPLADLIRHQEVVGDRRYPMQTRALFGSYRHLLREVARRDPELAIAMAQGLIAPDPRLKGEKKLQQSFSLIAWDPSSDNAAARKVYDLPPKPATEPVGQRSMRLLLPEGGRRTHEVPWHLRLAMAASWLAWGWLSWRYATRARSTRALIGVGALSFLGIIALHGSVVVGNALAIVLAYLWFRHRGYLSWMQVEPSRDAKQR
jgi:hypothetical protein